MDSRQVTRGTPSRLAGGIVMALLVGGLLPLISLLQISLLVPTLMLGGLFAVYLYARNGWVPPAVLAAAAVISSGTLLGGTLTLILLAASLLPAAPVMLGMGKKRPFFDQLNAGVIAFGGGLLAALMIAYASFGGGMIARFVDTLRAEYNRMPDAVLLPMVDWVNAMLPSGTVGGGSVITVDSFRAQLSAMLDLMQQTYAQILPGALLSGALLTGALAVLWGNWTLARQGMATNQSFVGMSGWFLPARFSLGAVVLWGVGLVLMYGGSRNGATIYMTISQTVGSAFAVQALCALDRRMMRADRPRGRRKALIVLFSIGALLLRGMAAVLAYVGVASALFGSHGAIRHWMQNRRNDDSSNDDDSNR